MAVFLSGKTDKEKRASGFQSITGTTVNVDISGHGFTSIKGILFTVVTEYAQYGRLLSFSTTSFSVTISGSGATGLFWEVIGE